MASGADQSVELDDVAALSAVIEAKDEQIAQLAQAIKDLRAELSTLRAHMYGRSREAIHPDQLHMFGLGQGGAGDADTEAAEPPQPEPKPKAKKKKQGHGKGSFPAHLPRDEVRLELPEADRICADCGAAMQAFGEEVSERAHLIPARLCIRSYVRVKYSCAAGHSVCCAPMPEGVVEGGKYEPSVYAHVAVAKYEDHLPLNRLQKIFGRHRLKLPRQTMWDMLVRVDELVAGPILAQMRKELLREEVLHADETPVTFKLEEQKGGKQGYIWGWRSLRERGQSKVLIEFRTSRAGTGPTEFLGDFSGTLLTDGYSGYNEVIRANKISRAGCWVHARRKFRDALDGSKQAVSPILRMIQRLFWIERAIKDRIASRELSWKDLVATRGEVRERRSQKLLDKIYTEAQHLAQLRSTVPKGRLAKAIEYLFRQQAALRRSIEDPRLPIHNNDSERDLRHIAVGRKNWLVFASERGGAVAGRMYSLMLSCREAGVNPEAYLEDVLLRINTTRAADIAELTPWAWAAARAEASEAG